MSSSYPGISSLASRVRKTSDSYVNAHLPLEDNSQPQSSIYTVMSMWFYMSTCGVDFTPR